jgi:hypothetical protein
MDRFLIIVLLVAVGGLMANTIHTKEQLERRIATLEQEALKQQAMNISLTAGLSEQSYQRNRMDREQNAINKQLMDMVDLIIKKGSTR